MRIRLACLGILCAFGFAGAVSLAWTTSDWTEVGGDGHGITADSAFGLNGNNYGTFVLVGSLRSTNAYTWVTEVWGRNAYGDMQNYVAVGINNSGNWAIRNNNGWGNATVTTINTVREICEEGVQFSRMKSGASFIMAKTRRRVDD